MTPHAHCDSLYLRARRASRPVRVGDTIIGGPHPIVVQSMISCDTMDTDASVRDTVALAAVGCQIVRITAPTVRAAANLGVIRRRLREAGCDVPLVADIHFKPEAALEAALHVDKVRVNPGNYADSKKFQTREYTDAEYGEELDRVRERFLPLLELCRERAVAIRIGANHGSLSDRILNRYGDTPTGMVESALEFARFARERGFHDLVFSMKASNPKVMIQAYRLLIARMRDEGADWNYPIHLGVTEAGDGEDGRIKSAIGIGALLADGIGDTIRVSLTEDSTREIPVARALADLFPADPAIPPDIARRLAEIAPPAPFDPFRFARRASAVVDADSFPTGGDRPIRVAVTADALRRLEPIRASLGDCQPEPTLERCAPLEIDPLDDAALAALDALERPRLITVPDGSPLAPIPAFRLLAARVHPRHPILLKDTLAPGIAPHPPEIRLLASAANVGALLCDGIGDAILIRAEPDPAAALRLAYNILQAAGCRSFKTDYVACPSCGRTLFDLQTTTARVKRVTSHLKGVKIAIMGCIVNGPGEMADADFGYVGGAPAKVNLYVGKTPVKFNIPEADAVDQLVLLIKEHGRWIDPPERSVG